MGHSLVVTLLGDDRPGLVEALSRTVSSHGGNWLESRMARLGGKFAGVVRVDVPEEHELALCEALSGLAAEGLRIVAERGAGAEPAGAPWRPMRLELVGADHAGIVREVSHALAAHGVNVEELRTELDEAPMSGEALFRAEARLRLPPDSSADELRASLERIAADLIVDIRLDEQEKA